MFDIGFWELVTIAVIGVVVVGPERLPEVVRGCARVVRNLSRILNTIKVDIERELDLDGIRREFDELDMQEHIRRINQSVMDLDDEMNQYLENEERYHRATESEWAEEAPAEEVPPPVSLKKPVSLAKRKCP